MSQWDSPDSFMMSAFHPPATTSSGDHQIVTRISSSGAYSYAVPPSYPYGSVAYALSCDAGYYQLEPYPPVATTTDVSSRDLNTPPTYLAAPLAVVSTSPTSVVGTSCVPVGQPSLAVVSARPVALTPRVHDFTDFYDKEMYQKCAEIRSVHNNCFVSSCLVEETHFLILCPAFALLSIHQRWSLVVYYNLCVVCLSNVHPEGHFNCPYIFLDSGLICSENCSSIHNVLLHPVPVILPPLGCIGLTDECDCIEPFNYLAWWQCEFYGCRNLNFHEPHFCYFFLSMSPAQRWDCVRRNFLCFLCLKKGHRSYKCPEKYPASFYKCFCDLKLAHHVLLHPEMFPMDENVCDLSMIIQDENDEADENDENDDSSSVTDETTESDSESVTDTEVGLFCRPNIFLSEESIEFIRLLLQEKRQAAPGNDETASPSKIIKSCSAPVIFAARTVPLAGVVPDKPVLDERMTTSGSSDVSEDGGMTEDVQKSQLPRRPKFFSSQMISRPTLYVARMSMAEVRSVKELRTNVQYPHALLREGMALLCGKRPACLTLRLNEEQSLPLELEAGVNILSWSPSNLRVHPGGVGSSRPAGDDLEGNFLTFQLDGNFQLLGLDGQPLLQPVFSSYMLGDKPPKSGVIKPLHRPGRDHRCRDWRFKGWEKSLAAHDWPVAAPVVYVDVFVHYRHTHVVDYQPVTTWPLLERQFS